MTQDGITALYFASREGHVIVVGGGGRVFKVSERSILALLLFLKSLMSFLELDQIVVLLPRSIHSVKSALRIFQEQTVVEYVVCPECNSLYFLKDCIT